MPTKLFTDLFPNLILNVELLARLEQREALEILVGVQKFAHFIKNK